MGRPETLSERDAAALVTAAFRLVLGREPDAGGLRSYVDALREGRTATWLLESLGASDEFRRRADPAKARVDAAGLTARGDAGLAVELQRCAALSRARYDALWTEVFASGRALIVGQAEYAETHRQRFFELFNAVLVLTRGISAPRILEFGPSEFSAMFGRLVPAAEFAIVDRPVPADYVGFTEARCRAALRCTRYAAVDLAKVADMDAKLGALGAFDLIVLAEVIEHLPIHPVDLLTRIVRMLAPGGALYLTTPNFYAQSTIDRIARGENPGAVYPLGDGNWDAHHHYREFEAVELAGWIGAAGGRVDAFCYSDCWDPAGVALPAHRRGNMVFVVRRAAAA